MGEGAGALILEEYEHAKARGAKIYAEVVGGGMAADAYHLTGTHPQGDGAVLGMTLALEEAGIKPEELDYLNMHATSTPLGDVSELIAAKRVFGDKGKFKCIGYEVNDRSPIRCCWCSRGYCLYKGLGN